MIGFMSVLLIINVISAFAMMSVDMGTALISMAAAFFCILSIYLRLNSN